MAARSDGASRVGAGVLGLGILAVLVVAAWLEPDARGHGTHEALGMPACGWVVAFDRPCPTCGMTTAFSLAADGRYIESFLTQPMGAMLAAFGAAGVWVLGAISLGGARLWDEIAVLWRPKVVWTGVAMLGLAWAYTFVTWNSAG